ncbi:MAG TPA: methylated-DNA--[protein]-cysteine S-methyltransferase [Acidimicrobiales bacterium]
MTGTRWRSMDSPVGPLTLAGRGDVLTHLRMDGQTHPPPGRHRWRHDPKAFGNVVDQLDAYFASELTVFAVDLSLEGTDFQRRVWEALLEIPYAETRSYGQLADRIGRPGAARALGSANGHNPIGIIVPCHRVIGAGGALVGYGGGLPRKKALLQLEQDHGTPRLALDA